MSALPNSYVLCSDLEDLGRYRDVRTNLSEGARRGVQWLENQSSVLEEVDQLVELMAAEKAALNNKISTLKEEHRELLQREIVLGDENAKLKLENINKQSMLAIQEEQGAKVTKALKESLELTKQQLGETRSRMDGLRLELATAQEEARTLTAENCELKEKAKKCKANCTSMSTTLEIQGSENVKLTSALSCLREQCRKLQVEQNFLRSREKDLQDKLRITEDMILAMKSRASSAKRYEEQLKQKCKTLEKALEVATCTAKCSPAVTGSCPVSCAEKKSRVEMELLRDCKKKDEALACCSKELEECRAEQKKQRIEKNKLERTLHTERRRNSALSRELESLRREKAIDERNLLEKTDELRESRRRLRNCLGDLKASRKKEMEFCADKREVEMGLSRIEEELKRSKMEMRGMKMEVESKEEKWWADRQKTEQEKLQLIKTHHEAIDQMKEELLKYQDENHLDCCVLGGCGQGDRLARDQLARDAEVQLDQLLQESKEDYRRLKESSAKRCTELAKEVWKLKDQLQEGAEQSRAKEGKLKESKLCHSHQHILKHTPELITRLIS